MLCPDHSISGVLTPPCSRENRLSFRILKAATKKVAYTRCKEYIAPPPSTLGVLSQTSLSRREINFIKIPSGYEEIS